MKEHIMSTGLSGRVQGTNKSQDEVHEQV